MYGMVFDGDGDGFDVLLAAADDPTPATARAVAGDAPVPATGQGDDSPPSSRCRLAHGPSRRERTLLSPLRRHGGLRLVSSAVC